MPLDKPTMHDITRAAERAIAEVMVAAHAQLFLDHDPGSGQARITVGNSWGACNQRGAQAYCAEYTERAMPLAAVYAHQLIEGDDKFNMAATKDIIINALHDQWDLYVGYYSDTDDVFPRFLDDVHWAARTAAAIPGERTVSLWMDYMHNADDWRYFLWVTRELSWKSPPGAVRDVKDLAVLRGDYSAQAIAAKISKALQNHFPDVDLDAVWSHYCPLHHRQYKYAD